MPTIHTELYGNKPLTSERAVKGEAGLKREVFPKGQKN